MLLDFDSDKPFGNATYNIANPTRREFTSKDTTAVQQYIKARYEYLIQHRWPQ